MIELAGLWAIILAVAAGLIAILICLGRSPGTARTASAWLGVAIVIGLLGGLPLLLVVATILVIVALVKWAFRKLTS